MSHCAPYKLWIRKTEQRLLQLAGFVCHEKINSGNPIAEKRRGQGGGRGGVRSHVNTNTNLREEKRTVHCSSKMVFHIMNKKNEGIRIFFLKKESQSESGTKRAAHGMICNIIPHPKEEKTILILYSNKKIEVRQLNQCLSVVEICKTVLLKSKAILFRIHDQNSA